MTLSLALFFIGTFIAITLVMAAVRAALNRVDAPREPELGSDAFDAALLRDESLSSISFMDWLLKRFDWVEIMKLRLSEAGMAWSVGRLTILMLVSGSATWVFLRTLGWMPGWIVAVGSVAAGVAPYLVVLRRRERRLRRIEQQLPEALDTLARSLRAGNPLAVGLEVLARELPAPLAQEMRRTVDARALGAPLETALDGLARRIPVAEMRSFVAAVQIQSRTGGKLHDVFSQLAETMREAEALKSEVASIAAHGRLTGLILTAMPVCIAAVMSYTNPDQMLILWNHPMGKHLIAAAVMCLVLAHIIIQRMVNVRI